MVIFYQCNDSSPHFSSFQRHSYGKGIQGASYVRFGIIDGTKKKVFLPGLEQQLSVSTVELFWFISDKLDIVRNYQNIEPCNTAVIL